MTRCRICSKHVYWIAGLMVSSSDAPTPLYRLPSDTGPSAHTRHTHTRVNTVGNACVGSNPAAHTRPFASSSFSCYCPGPVLFCVFSSFVFHKARAFGCVRGGPAHDVSSVTTISPPPAPALVPSPPLPALPPVAPSSPPPLLPSAAIPAICRRVESVSSGSVMSTLQHPARAATMRLAPMPIFFPVL
jgi:hypothetical protein